jgi:hypothetical protein
VEILYIFFVRKLLRCDKLRIKNYAHSNRACDRAQSIHFLWMEDNFFRWVYLSDIFLKGNKRLMQGNVLKDANVEQDSKILRN